MRAVAACLDRRARVWRDEVFEVVGDRGRLVPDADATGLPRLDGVVTGAFTDAHVHLQLVDHAQLATSRLGQVCDLGGNPDVVARLARQNSGDSTETRADSTPQSTAGRASPEFWRRSVRHPVRVAFAGAFLTPPGGYPSDRSWAPAGSVREIADADAAEAAILEMKAAGATCIKVASNASAGPVFTDEMFTAIVELASAHDMAVIAHAEGPGEALRVTRLRARQLAHAPFSEVLSDDDLSRMHGSVAWISTLSIHEGEAYRIAVDNVRRFHALGGTILYGTDMGNGDTPVDLNPREIAALREAGIDGADLLRSLIPTDPHDPASALLFFPGTTPDTADPLFARLLTADDLKV
ncbi:hypothetical protein ACI3KS_12790 [Microbacterium sp. ZW T5_45]|uniref:hypothetical protein n=1 Tax=Microbacterium sp. ZW T5_45 TaxID=3378080 RepID=UPI00385397F3